MKWKKVLGIGLAAMLTATCLAGCGGSGKEETEKKTVGEEKNAGDKVKLRLMSISTDGNQTKILEYIKENLAEALPDVEVEFEPGGGGEDMANKLKTYNASGDLPDVWYSTADSAAAIRSAGNMENLTDYVTEDGFLDNYAIPDALKFQMGIFTV